MSSKVKIHTCLEPTAICLPAGLLVDQKQENIHVSTKALNQSIWIVLYRLPRMTNNKALVRIMDPYVRLLQSDKDTVVYDNLQGTTVYVVDKRLMQTPWFRRRKDSPWRMQLMMSPSLFQCAPGTCYWVPSHPSLNDLIDVVVTQPSAPGVSQVRLTMSLMNQFQTYNVACRPAKKQGQRYYVFDVVISPKIKTK
jgi:hypothetical protein